MLPRDHLRIRIPWGVLIFMLAFAVLIAIVSRYYLIPAMLAAKDATVREKRLLTAVSRLLLVVILFVVGVGIVLTFRVSRFFFPRQGQVLRTKTTYVDAWAESGKRMEPPAEDEDSLPSES
jgi:hypothetical protein